MRMKCVVYRDVGLIQMALWARPLWGQSWHVCADVSFILYSLFTPAVIHQHICGTGQAPPSLRPRRWKSTDSCCVICFHPTWLTRSVSNKYKEVFIFSWTIYQLRFILSFLSILNKGQSSLLGPSAWLKFWAACGPKLHTKKWRTKNCVQKNLYKKLYTKNYGKKIVDKNICVKKIA